MYIGGKVDKKLVLCVCIGCNAEYSTAYSKYWYVITVALPYNADIGVQDFSPRYKWNNS